MYESLRGRVALITGSGAGIGRAIAIRLGREGCLVAVNDLRADSADAVAGEVVDGGGTARAYAADMTVAEAVDDVLAAVVRDFGRLDILVNNVGLFTFGDLATLELGDWEACMDVNVTSTFLCSRASIPHLRGTGGTIVNISSGAGKVGGTSSGAYATSKWAVLGLTKSLAMELAPDIRVNAVCPGIIETAMDAAFVDRAAAAAGVSAAEFVAGRLRSIPLRRHGTAEDVANAVAFLVSDEAGYTTGEGMNVSGGLVIH